MVVALIGANDYGFADIVQQCVLDWLTSPSWWKNYCNDDSSMTSKFTAVERRRDHHARRRTPSSTCAPRCATRATPTARGRCSRRPTPRRCRAASQIRYSGERLHAPDVGGCGSGTPTPTGPTTPSSPSSTDGARRARRQRDDEHRALRGAERARRPPAVREHRRPARGAGRSRAGARPGAADRSEWVSQIRTTTTLFGPYQLQEDAHPSYWGQLALRNCVRQAYNAGAPRGGHLQPHDDRAQRPGRAEHELRLTLDDELGLRLGHRLGGLLPRRPRCS